MLDHPRIKWKSPDEVWIKLSSSALKDLAQVAHARKWPNITPLDIKSMATDDYVFERDRRSDDYFVVWAIDATDTHLTISTPRQFDRDHIRKKYVRFYSRPMLEKFMCLDVAKVVVNFI